MRDRLCNRIRPYQIDTTGLTHLYFAFVQVPRPLRAVEALQLPCRRLRSPDTDPSGLSSIDPVSFEVSPMNIADIGLYYEFTALKKPGYDILKFCLDLLLSETTGSKPG